ncbi:MAG: transcriptional regulator [Phototrophicales bacterium]|nr:MAG: transcriptional regulator [Phototrophicales bacterium]
MKPPQLAELQLLHERMCHSIGDPVRLQILYALYQNPTYVSALAEQLELPQSTVSRHLSILRRAKVVSSEREGRCVVYRLVDERLIDVLELLRVILHSAHQEEGNIYEQIFLDRY